MKQSISLAIHILIRAFYIQRMIESDQFIMSERWLRTLMVSERTFYYEVIGNVEKMSERFIALQCSLLSVCKGKSSVDSMFFRAF